MTDLPTSTIVAGAGGTAGSGGAAFLNDLRDVVGQMPGGQAFTERTISSGAIVPNRCLHTVDTEGDAATDDLTTISTSALPSGSVIVLIPAATGRTIVVKHNVSAIALSTGADFSMTDSSMAICLYRDGSVWRELWRSYGNQAATARAALSITDMATYAEASTAESQAGLLGAVLMTPRRVYDAIKTAALMITNRAAQTTPAAGDEFLFARGGYLYKITQANLIGSANTYWDSGEIAIDSAQSGTVAVSGTGAFTTPKSSSAFLVCKSSDAGYGVGDKLEAGSVTGFQVSWGTAQLKWSRNSTFTVTSENGGAAASPLTPSRWRLRVYARG